jgi:hypothetical protein
VTEQAGGNGAANDATAGVSTDQGTPQQRPAGIPADYLWDPGMGPIEDSTGQPRGAWREPTDEERKQP